MNAAQKKFGIERTKEVVSDLATIGRAAMDGVGLDDIRVVPNLINVVKNTPEVVREASDYDAEELQELGLYLVTVLGGVLVGKS